MIKIFTKENIKDEEKMRKCFIVLLNFMIFIFSTVGITLALVFAQRDGYSHWYKRLLYFTQLSNIWIGVVSLVFAIMMVREILYNREINKKMYLVKFVFTVSITITGMIFCTLLAPFADFDVWSFSSVLTHVVVPVLSIVEFFLSCNGYEIKRSQVSFSIIPPAVYFLFASILSICKVDFGRGDTFPYFFMDFHSEVGAFGFKMAELPQFGAFYWMLFFIVLIYGLGYLYRKAYNQVGKKFT